MPAGQSGTRFLVSWQEPEAMAPAATDADLKTDPEAMRPPEQGFGCCPAWQTANPTILR